MELNICMSDTHHRYYKHTKFHQNPRGDPKFLVDLTWNDPNRFMEKRLLTTKTPNRCFAKPRPLFKNYGNRPAAIFIGAGRNNCDCAALKFDVDD